METRILREPFIVTDSLRNRFKAKTIVDSSGCIYWTGCRNPNGYGKVKICGRTMDAHVASWRIANDGQPVPVGLLIMHSCDNRSCVNPDHLSCGTSQQNIIDCRDKDRMSVKRGSDAYNAALSESVVEQIRQQYVPYKRGFSQIARELGVSETCVRRACKGETCKHVTKSEAEAVL
jgi:hypothetical protein